MEIVIGRELRGFKGGEKDIGKKKSSKKGKNLGSWGETLRDMDREEKRMEAKKPILRRDLRDNSNEASKNITFFWCCLGF